MDKGQEIPTQRRGRARSPSALHGEGACPHAPQAGRAVAPRPPPLVRLGDVCAQVRGVSYKPRDARGEFAAGYVPLLRANNIGENGLNHDEIVYVKRECVKDFQFLHPGDLLVCASSGSRHLVGKAAQILSDEQETFGAFCKVVRPDPQRILPDYLAQYFQSDVYRRTIANKAAGANINNIRSEHIDDLQIPLPPLPEQKRIAAILDKICEMKRNAEARLQKLDLLVKARFVEMFGDVGKRKFPSVKLKEVMQIKHGYAFEGDGFSSSDNGIVLVTPGNFRIGGGFKSDKNRYFTKGYPEDYVLKAGSLIVTMTDLSKRSDTLGYAAIVPRDKNLYLHNQRIGLAHSFSQNVNIVYLEHAMRTQEYRQSILATQVGSTVHHTSPTKILDSSVPLPPLALQRQFAAFVEKVEGLKATAKKELEQVDLLYRAKLQEFFG